MKRVLQGLAEADKEINERIEKRRRSFGIGEAIETEKKARGDENRSPEKPDELKMTSWTLPVGEVFIAS